LEEDWLTRWADEVKMVSDPAVRTIWARILAGEAENPGSFSKRTLEFLRTLEKSEAEGFTDLCRYVVDVEGFVTPIVFGYEDFHHLGTCAAERDSRGGGARPHRT
jgi:Protein of unknown function (DUF2806)